MAALANCGYPNYTPSLVESAENGHIQSLRVAQRQSNLTLTCNGFLKCFRGNVSAVTSSGSFFRQQSLKRPRPHQTDRRQPAYSVEKLRFTMIRKFKGIFSSPGARITDQLCRSELRQAGFSCDFCYPLVHTLRNAAHIAIKIAAHFKTEFFNRIVQKRPFRLFTAVIHLSRTRHLLASIFRGTRL